MIHVVLRGQLGNWMFQIATARHLARRRGCPLVVNLSRRLRRYDWHGGWVRRQLRQFPLQPRFSLKPPWLLTPRSWAGLEVPAGHAVYYKENHFHFDPHVLELPSGSVLYGFFQSDRYFSDIEDQVRRDFAFPPLPRRSEVLELAERMVATTSVSVHVRRGDSLRNRSLVVLAPDYYLAAFEELRQRLGTPRFFVFSDDFPYCRQHFSRFPDVEFVEVGEKGEQPILDMTLMSRCRHHIIANSTFSWWGAWLDQRPDKQVIVPDRWFVDPDKDGRATRMLLQLGWLRRSPTPSSS